MEAERWCVIGGGMLGLSIAHGLARSGQRVTVWESSDELGGLVTPSSIGSVTWDRFYHVITSYDEHALRLLRALNLEREIHWRSPQTGFYAGQHLHPFSSIADFIRFPALNAIDKFRFGTTILRAAAVHDPLPLEKVTAVAWLTQLSGREVVERIWLPLLRARLGADAERVNAAFIWAMIARTYGARQGPGKRELFGYVPGGYRHVLSGLIARLAELDVVLHTGRPAERVTGGDEQVAIEDGRSLEWFDRVVITVPAPVAAGLCPELMPNEIKRLRDVEYQGVICASMLLKRPLSPYYITNITDAMPFATVIEMDALVDRDCLDHRALVYLPKYLHSNDPGFERGDESIRKEFIAGLNRIHPDFGMNDVSAFRVSRARHVLPIPTLDYSERVPPFTTSMNRAYIVNSAQIVNGTPSVNQTLELSERALLAICDDAARPRRTRVSAKVPAE